MKITVIIPYHDRDAAYLGDALESVRRQTRPADTVIVVDDCSSAPPDCPSWVTVLRTPRNRGPGGARNYALVRAHADAFAFLDADDVWLPDKLAEQERVLAGARGADWSYTNCWYWGRGTVARQPNSWFHGFAHLPIWRDVRMAHLQGHNFVTMSSVMIRQEAMNGGFRDDLPISEDWELFTRLSNRVVACQKPLHLYRLKGNGHHAAHLSDYVRVNTDILIKMWERLSMAPPSVAIARIYERAAIQHLNAGRPRMARRLLWSSEISPLARSWRVRGLRLMASLPRAAWPRLVAWRTGVCL